MNKYSRGVAQCLLFCFVTFFGDLASRSKCTNITMQEISQENDQKIASEDSRRLARYLSLLFCYLLYRLSFAEQVCQRHDARNHAGEKIKRLLCLSLLLDTTRRQYCSKVTNGLVSVTLARATPPVTGSLPMTPQAPLSNLQQLPGASTHLQPRNTALLSQQNRQQHQQHRTEQHSPHSFPLFE